MEDVNPVLYRLPELMAADPSKPVFFVEGEKDVERLIAVGLVATTNPMGAGKWRPEYAACLKGRSVVVIPDNDKAGRDHAAAVAVSLQGLAKIVKVLELPGLPEKGDTSDWLDQGHQVEELIELAGAADEWEPEGFRTSESIGMGDSEESSIPTIILSTDIPPPEHVDIEGLLGPFIPPQPALVLLSGESSAGKTVLSYNLAYHLASGEEFAGLLPRNAFRVLYCDLENPTGVHRTLVDTIGRSENLGFCRRFLKDLTSPRGRAEFLGLCKGFNADVILIDPLSVAWPVNDEDSNSEADQQMWGLKQIAIELHCVVVVLWNMGQGNVKDKFKARGATARVDRSDLGLNYIELNDNTRQLKVVKSRYATMNEVLTLRFAGDMGFEAVEGTGGITQSAIADMTIKVKDELRSGVMTRQELIAKLGNDDLLDKALSRLVSADEISKPKRGSYELVVSSESPTSRGKDSEETTDGGSAPDD
jgi:archaellum biogenesis ATPase FlaH